VVGFCPAEAGKKHTTVSSAGLPRGCAVVRGT
jgi:hypothetical protein